MKRLISLALALILTCSMVWAAPPREDTEPPIWKQFGFSSQEEMLTALDLTEDEYYGEYVAPQLEQQHLRQQQEAEFAARYPQEYAAFDAYAWFEESYPYYYYGSAQDYMADWNMTEAEFVAEMRQYWIGDVLTREAMQKEIDDYAAAHPKQYAAFSVDVWFAGNMSACGTPQQYMDWAEIDREEFDFKVTHKWATVDTRLEEGWAEIREYLDQHPEEYQSFDPEVWVTAYHSYGSDRATYQRECFLTDEEFRLDMTQNWVYTQKNQEYMAQSVAEYATAYPEIYANFDADREFLRQYGDGYTQEEYRADHQMTQQQLETELAYHWIWRMESYEDVAAQLAEYAAEYPAQYAAFDPMQEYERSYYSFYYDSAEEYMQAEGLGQEQFRLEMAELWMSRMDRQSMRQQEVEQYIREHPEQYARFDPDAYFAHYYSWYDSSQEYMDNAGFQTREEFVQDMTYLWVSDQQHLEVIRADWDAFAQENPEKAAAFNADALFYGDSFYVYYYETPENYRLQTVRDQEAYELYMKQDYMFQVEGEQWERDYIRQELTALGGDPDSINVMRNGKMLSFEDVKPEITAERTMVPFAQTMRQMGAQPVYDSEGHSVTVTLKNLRLEHKIGTDVFTLTGPEEELTARFEDCAPVAGRAGVVTAQLTMDVASYIRDGRTMVPLSFFAGALGYDVTWDQQYQTVLLLDQAELARQIDTDFSLLNRVFKAYSGLAPTEGGAVASQEKVNLSVTLTEEGKKPQSYAFSLNADALYDHRAINATITGQLGDLLPLMENTGGENAFTPAERLLMQQLLKDLRVDYILDLEKEVVFLKGELIDLLMKEAGEELGLEPGDYQWLGLYLQALPLALDSQLATLYSRDLSLGKSIAQAAALLDSVSFWSSYQTTMQTLKTFVGDDAFTKSGNTYTLQYDLIDLMRLSDPDMTREQAEEEMSWYLEELPQMELMLTVTPQNDSCVFQFTFDLDYDILAMNAALGGTAQHLEGSLTVDAEGYVSLDLILERDMKHDTTLPATAPPEGEGINYIQAGY